MSPEQPPEYSDVGLEYRNYKIFVKRHLFDCSLDAQQELFLEAEHGKRVESVDQRERKPANVWGAVPAAAAPAVECAPTSQHSRWLTERHVQGNGRAGQQCASTHQPWQERWGTQPHQYKPGRAGI
jgi:hypothetical protein